MLASKAFKRKSLPLRIQAMLWLVFTLVLIVFTILLWMYSKSPVDTVVTNEDVTEEVALVQEITIQKDIELVNDLNYYVAPVQFKTIIRDLRQYPDEFKDEKFLSDNKSKWSLEIMSVEKHEVITDYLNGREDRNEFSYFRHTDDKNHTKYTLIYGIADGSREAMQFLQEVDFNLPSSVTVIPEEIKRYTDMVDNYVRAEEVFDLSGNRPKEVILRPTRRLVAVRHPKPKIEKPLNTTNKKTQFNGSKAPKRSSQVIKQDKILKEAAKQKEQKVPKPFIPQD